MKKSVEETDAARYGGVMIKNSISDLLNLRCLLVQMLIKQLNVRVWSSRGSCKLEFESSPYKIFKAVRLGEITDRNEKSSRPGENEEEPPKESKKAPIR